VKSVEIKVLCDQCLKAEDSGPRPADHTFIYRIGDDDEQEYRVDLCAGHAKRLLLSDTIALGHTWNGGGIPHRRPRVQCPICGQSVGYGSGLALHTKATHPADYRPKEAR
jgi:hypothetical protein